jgi:hypothetical protein
MKKYNRDALNRYVKLDNRMTESAAWTSLSDGATWLYIELMKTFDFKNGGFERMTLPFRRVSWRMSCHSFKKRIQELIHYGFIDLIEKGGLYKQPNIYKRSNRWEHVSKEIVDKEGREAIRLGMAQKRRKANNPHRLQNLLIGDHSREKRT